MLSIAVLLVVVAACAVLVGGTDTLNGASPRRVMQNRPDLTNQASPLVCTFRDGQSYTPLASPPAEVGLERVAGRALGPVDARRA